MNNQYLIPANSKKSQLIFSIFTVFDLVLFAIGIATTIILLIVVKSDSMVVMVLNILPAIVTGVLVLPIPNYHNMLVVVSELIGFFMNQRNFLWKGWCVRVGYKNDNGK